MSEHHHARYKARDQRPESIARAAIRGLSGRGIPRDESPAAMADRLIKHYGTQRAASQATGIPERTLRYMKAGRAPSKGNAAKLTGGERRVRLSPGREARLRGATEPRVRVTGDVTHQQDYTSKRRIQLGRLIEQQYPGASQEFVNDLLDRYLEGDDQGMVDLIRENVGDVYAGGELDNADSIYFGPG